MPNFRHGKDTRVLLGARDASPYLNSAEVSTGQEAKETSAFGTRDKSYIPGIREASISIGGMYDGTIGAIDELMDSLHTNTATYPVTVAQDGGIAVGRNARIGSVWQTSYDASSPVDDIVSISGELTVNNGVRAAKIMNAEAPVTGTVTGTSVDWGAASATSRGGMMNVHVLANTRSTATTVVVQSSPDNSVWTDVTTQSVPSGTVAGYSVVVPTGTVARYTRALITPTAGTGSAVIIVAFGRN